MDAGTCCIVSFRKGQGSTCDKQQCEEILGKEHIYLQIEKDILISAFCCSERGASKAGRMLRALYELSSKSVI